MDKYNVLDVFSWNYMNSYKKSIDQYTLEIDRETFNNLLSSQYSQTTLEENAVPCLIYRKPADMDNKNLSAQFFLSKYEKNHFNPDDVTKYQTHEIQINDKNILENIENSIKEYNNYEYHFILHNEIKIPHPFSNRSVGTFYVLETDPIDLKNIYPDMDKLNENQKALIEYTKYEDGKEIFSFNLYENKNGKYIPQDLNKGLISGYSFSDGLKENIKEYINEIEFERKSPLDQYIILEARRVKFYNEENEYGSEYPDEKDKEIYEALSKITYDEYLDKYSYSKLDLKEIVGQDYFSDNRCWSYLSDSIDSMFSSHDFIKDEKNYTYLFPNNFINSASELIGYSSLEYIGNYKFSDLGPCQVITGKKHDLMELAYDNSYKLNPECLYEKENLNLEDAKKIKGLKIPKDDKKYKGKSFYEWAKSDAEDPRHLEYTIQVEGKDTAAFNDINAYISPSGMNLLRNSTFVNAEYSDDKIKVTCDFDKESYKLFHDEFLKTNDFDCNIQKEKVFGNVNIINKKNNEILNNQKLTQEDIELCRQVVPDQQFSYTISLIKNSEEKGFYIDKFKEIADICRERTFSEPKEDGMPAFHYFLGDTHIYISELYAGNQIGKCDGYAFGYTILNGDLQMSEWGDSSLEEIKSIAGMEMDYYFDRSKKIDSILKDNYPDYFKKLDEKESELELQKSFLEKTNETFCESVNEIDKSVKVNELESRLTVPEENKKDFIETIDKNTKTISENTENTKNNHKGRK